MNVEHYDFVWRETLSDGFIAVSSYQNEVKEKVEKDLKDEKFDFEKVVTENLCLLQEKYLPKANVYHQKYGYLVVKKFDEAK